MWIHPLCPSKRTMMNEIIKVYVRKFVCPCVLHCTVYIIMIYSDKEELPALMFNKDIICALCLWLWYPSKTISNVLLFWRSGLTKTDHKSDKVNCCLWYMILTKWTKFWSTLNWWPQTCSLSYSALFLELKHAGVYILYIWFVYMVNYWG